MRGGKRGGAEGEKREGEGECGRRQDQPGLGSGLESLLYDVTGKKILALFNSIKYQFSRTTALTTVITHRRNLPSR